MRTTRAALTTLLCLCAVTAGAQQPFAVDDAEVTPAGWWHVELSNQVDVLHESSRPAIWQNVFDAEVVYGALPRLEIGVAVPAISLASDVAGRRSVASGVSDTSLSAKVRLTRDPAARHAFAAGLTVEFPSGDQDRQLGSGLVDYGIAVISQHRLDARWTIRGNGGLVLAGNTQTGALGFTDRGTVVTGGASLVGAAGDTLQIGGEVVVAWSEKATLGGKSIVAQVGGNLALRPGLTLDLGVGTGWFDATPRVAIQVGISLDLGAPSATPHLRGLSPNGSPVPRDRWRRTPRARPIGRLAEA